MKRYAISAQDLADILAIALFAAPLALAANLLLFHSDIRRDGLHIEWVELVNVIPPTLLGIGLAAALEIWSACEVIEEPPPALTEPEPEPVPVPEAPLSIKRKEVQ